jgi:hypothetical protein
VKSRFLPLIVSLAGMLAVSGCTALLGDFKMTWSEPPESGAEVDASLPKEAGGADQTSADVLGGDQVPDNIAPADESVDQDTADTVTDVTNDADGGSADAGCAPGFADCDGDPSNGCEADLSLASHCGTCATTCTGAAPMCASQGGSFVCTSGCPSTGPTLCGTSCVDMTTDPKNCATCGHACPVVTSGQATCVSSACDFLCDANFHRCGASCADDTSTSSCGSSCTACGAAPANGAPTCDGTNCGFSCNSGFHKCGSACADSTSVSSCGTSCVACPIPANGAATCTGMCGISCNMGYSPCSGACFDELADSAHCGSCTKQCSGGVNCTSGRCVVRDGQLQSLSSTTACSPNFMFAIQVTVPNAITVTALGSTIKTVTAGNVLVMGIYTTTGTQPGTLIAQSALAYTDTLGNKEIPTTSSPTIAAGTYWVAANTGTTSSTWAWGWDGTQSYFVVSYTYTGSMPATMPSGSGTGSSFNYFVVGYE